MKLPNIYKGDTTQLTLFGKIMAALFGLSIVGGLILAINFIPFLLWNKVVAPTFGWPQAGFWKVFFICLAISWFAGLIRGGHKK